MNPKLNYYRQGGGDDPRNILNAYVIHSSDHVTVVEIELFESARNAVAGEVEVFRSLRSPSVIIDGTRMVMDDITYADGKVVLGISLHRDSIIVTLANANLVQSGAVAPGC